MWEQLQFRIQKSGLEVRLVYCCCVCPLWSLQLDEIFLSFLSQSHCVFDSPFHVGSFIISPGQFALYCEVWRGKVNPSVYLWQLSVFSAVQGSLRSFCSPNQSGPSLTWQSFPAAPGETLAWWLKILPDRRVQSGVGWSLLPGNKR